MDKQALDRYITGNYGEDQYKQFDTEGDIDMQRPQVGEVVRRDDMDLYMSPADAFEEAQALTPFTVSYTSQSRDCDGGHGYRSDKLLDMDRFKDGSLESVCRQVFAIYFPFGDEFGRPVTCKITPEYETLEDWEWRLDSDSFVYVGTRERRVLVGYTFDYSMETDEGYSAEAITVYQSPWHETEDSDRVYDEYAEMMGY